MIIKKISTLLCISAIFFVSCAKDYGMDISPDSPYKETADDSPMSPPGTQNGTPGEPGKVTAAEWNDLDHWAFWCNLMTADKSDQEGGNYTGMPDYWRFYTDRRVSIHVTDAQGNNLNDVKVELASDGNTIWTARTDVFGKAECWVGLYDRSAEAGQLSVSLNGVRQEMEPKITSWSLPTPEVNEYVFSADAPSYLADIMFIVDATGSMSDEIEFLKADLMDILNKVSSSSLSTSIRTAALFYRDEGDAYVTRCSGFTSSYAATINFISDQTASGGGDYPEAVHTALETSLQEFSWSSSARARIAFMLLDAPPHQDRTGVIGSLQRSIEAYAAQGIKLIPVASSGVDKNTEFVLRFFATATGGTYVFITNDSGIGNKHIAASVGQYEVEFLNDLLVRLITKYIGS